MAYSELIKDFKRIRLYLRDFYVYGFKVRGEFTEKSARSYDNERRRQAELILSDRRGVLDRFMRLFCWLEKKTVPLEPKDGVMEYHVTLHYEKTDEPELVIRLLSMGPEIRILSPDSLRQEIIRRVRNQRALLQ